MTKDIWPVLQPDSHVRRGIYVATAICPPDLVVLILRGKLCRAVLPPDAPATTQRYEQISWKDLVEYGRLCHGIQLVGAERESYIDERWKKCEREKIKFNKNAVATLYNVTAGKIVNIQDCVEAAQVEERYKLGSLLRHCGRERFGHLIETTLLLRNLYKKYGERR